MYIIIKHKLNTYGPFKSKNLTIKDVFDMIHIPLNGHYELFTYLKVDNNKKIMRRKKKIDINKEKYLKSGIYEIEEKKDDLEKKDNTRFNSLQSEISNISEQKKLSNNKSNSRININSIISEQKRLKNNNTNNIINVNSNNNKPRKISNHSSSRDSIKFNRNLYDVSYDYGNIKNEIHNRPKV